MINLRYEFAAAVILMAALVPFTGCTCSKTPASAASAPAEKATAPATEATACHSRFGFYYSS